jgi:hypothetical protein
VKGTRLSVQVVSAQLKEEPAPVQEPDCTQGPHLGCSYKAEGLPMTSRIGGGGSGVGVYLTW